MFVRRSFDDVMKINRVALRFSGALSLGGAPSKWKTKLRYFLAMFSMFSYTMLTGPMFHVLIFTSAEDLDDFLDIVILLMSITGGQIKTLLMIMNGQKTQRLLSICETWWTEASSAEQKIMTVWGDLGVLLTKILICNGIFTAFAFVLSPVIIRIMRFNNSTIRALPFRMNINTSVSPQYEIVYVVQAVAAQSCALSIIASEVMVIVLILHVCGQLEVIKYCLSDMCASNAETQDGSESCEDPEEALKRCIKLHRVVLDYCMELEEFVGNMNLVTVLVWMYVISLSAASFLRAAGSYGSVPLCCVGILQVFFLCWPAQTLSSKSLEVVNAVYDVPWYRGSKRFRTAITIMMTRAQRPAVITIGKYSVLSLETFSRICSSAGSFFMVLNRI